MRRTIVEPADLSGAALDDLKDWLGITRSNEDSRLLSLLRSALSTCEAFTGQSPLSQLVEERLPVRRGSTQLSARPVASLATVEVVAQGGSRMALEAESFSFELQQDGTACFQLYREVEGQAIAVRVRTGIAGTWNDIPGPLKQGIIRLCAFEYRERDRVGESKSLSIPPASVSALWRPWRGVRIA
ncbi:hypothetical protein NAP1_12118 [Erythrobacter sp. NAP1]|uniref:head-tail connector protein n=1 Tax=Erythrobacter sp. NAP1 TaxID=237727 RepID=UPI000068796B|nr:phage head-tail connector protein [Erythrobacter sp. NAP1]EAQ28341.1 hypothetical protein NAP1_12118 [Erythrobacter sp. NAP1]